MNEKPMHPSKRCAYTKADGTQCKGAHMKASKYCFAHDPENAAYRKAVASKAGSQRWRKDAGAGAGQVRVENGSLIVPADMMKLGLPTEGAIEVTCVADLQVLMNRLLTLSFSGKANAQLVNAITGAIRVSAKLLELDVLEKRLKELEQQLGQG